MKSKEALENWYNTNSANTKMYEYEQHYRIIKKDLDTLELLKEIAVVDPMTLRAIEVSENYEKYEKNCEMMGCLIVRTTVYNKIKEWLENE